MNKRGSKVRAVLAALGGFWSGATWSVLIGSRQVAEIERQAEKHRQESDKLLTSINELQEMARFCRALDQSGWSVSELERSFKDTET